jgi:hypothetical protein
VSSFQFRTHGGGLRARSRTARDCKMAGGAKQRVAYPAKQAPISPKISWNSSNSLRGIETPRSERIRFSAHFRRHSADSKLVHEFLFSLVERLKEVLIGHLKLAPTRFPWDRSP